MPTRKTPAATDATFRVVEDVLKDVSRLFSDEFVHLGGDEVIYICLCVCVCVRARAHIIYIYTYCKYR
jgi:N-acetyl-beta-hexosaminidase